MTNKKENNANDEEFEAYKKAIENLNDGPFKEFYINNPKEIGYLSKKIDIGELESFAIKDFSMADVMKCLYIKAFIKKYELQSEAFKEVVLEHGKKVYDKKCAEREERKQQENNNTENGKPESKKEEEQEKEENKKMKDINYILKKYSVSFIEDIVTRSTPKGKRKEFAEYSVFRRTKQRNLKTVIEYAFNDSSIMEKFKLGNYYKLNSVEAMLIFFILDEEYKKEIKHIRMDEEHLIKRRYLNGLKRYAIAIDKKRELSSDNNSNSISKLYKKRVKALKSDLITISELINTALAEYEKGDDADIEVLSEISKKCIRKLKKFVKRENKSKAAE